MKKIAKLLFLVLLSRTSTAQVLNKTHERFIAELNAPSQFEINNIPQVFEFIFRELGDTVHVYPTENYFYFEFYDKGISYKGNIGLFRELIDHGELNFNYQAINNDNPLGGSSAYGIVFGKNDGLQIENLNQFVTKVTYKDKAVVFKLNKLDLSYLGKYDIPGKSKAIGITSDESGYQFVLKYSYELNNFYWVLDDYNRKYNFIKTDNHIQFCNRTKFVFFENLKDNELVLIGVQKSNVANNTWYDGPFDQLPDNYISTDEVDLGTYLKLVYPDQQLDKYGNFINDQENRIAITNYIIYEHLADLYKIVNAGKSFELKEVLRNVIYEVNKSNY